MKMPFDHPLIGVTIRFSLVVVALIACLAGSFTAADVQAIKLSSIFADDMILQGGKANLIYGTATPRINVSVRLADRTMHTTAAEDGSWKIELPPMPAGGPYELNVDGGDHITLKNVDFGDVWLCFGQSNMALELSVCKHTPADIETAKLPLVRFFQIDERQSDRPAKKVCGHWVTTAPETVGELSACAFYFARDMYEKTKVPVGIISCCAEGLPLRSWLSEHIGGQGRDFFGHRTSAIFNGMVAPIAGTAVKGMVWYQGEADVFAAGFYKKMLPKMFADLRRRWRDPGMPILVVQLPNYSQKDSQPADSIWAEFREAQAEAVRKTRDAYLVVTIDTGSGQFVSLHPDDKRMIAHRLALVAQSLPADRADSFQSPEYSSMNIEPGAIKVTFNCHGKRLLDNGDRLEGFTIAGADNIFHWAEATVEPNGIDVLVCSSEVPAPLSVRYAWGDNPVCNLYSSTRQPAAPFRSDKCLAHGRGGKMYRRYDFVHS